MLIFLNLGTMAVALIVALYGSIDRVGVFFSDHWS